MTLRAGGRKWKDMLNSREERSDAIQGISRLMGGLRVVAVATRNHETERGHSGT